ncbi:MAG TPA: hypothetical protein VN920_03630 [Pyrinomonadaceae bacterium]|nr:hypothetical protein [Pyrinomonadaceae bacterium]
MISLLPYLLNLLIAKAFQRSVTLVCLTLVLSSSPAIASNGRNTGGEPLQPGTASYNDVEGLAVYNWNLSDRQRPLLNLPDQLSPNIDFSLSYPMDQFAFPLSQSLYFNRRSDEYLLILIPKTGRRARLVDLVRNGRADTYSDRATGFLLRDSRNIKTIRSGDGTEFTSARFADGEFRCSHVSDGRSPALTLTYANDHLLQRIVDSGGRTVRLNYQSGHVASITQTWSVNSALSTRTWTMSEGKEAVRRAHGNSSQPTALRIVKRMPSNAATPNYTIEMAENDRALARIFGDPGAVAAANGFEPVALATQYPLYRGDLVGEDGRKLRGHLSYAMHLYGSADGTGDSALYVPAGFTSHTNAPTPTDAAVTFYYPRLGNLTDITLAVFHVANFGLRYEGGRVRIGNIGGPGGSSLPYKHSHIEFYRGNSGLPSSSVRPSLRIDPVRVFDLRSQVALKARD